MDTDALVQALVADARPVHRVASPLLRATLWFVVAAYTVGLVLYVVGPRETLGADFGDPSFMLPWVGAVLASALAAFAAFAVTQPGSREDWALIPLGTVILWLQGIAFGCFFDWMRDREATATTGTGILALVALLAIAAAVGAFMVWLLRPTAHYRPIAASAWAAVAAGGLASATLSLFLPLGTAGTVLVWHGSAVTVLVVCAVAVLPRTVFRPRALPPAPPPRAA